MIWDQQFHIFVAVFVLPQLSTQQSQFGIKISYKQLELNSAQQPADAKSYLKTSYIRESKIERDNV